MPKVFTLEMELHQEPNLINGVDSDLCGYWIVAVTLRARWGGERSTHLG